MNFTQEIKRELTRRAPRTREEGVALLCGVLDAGGRREGEGCFLSLESESTAEYLLALSESVGGEMTLTEASLDPKHGKDKLTFYLAGEWELGEERTEEERIAYLKGAFLGGGSCTLPRAGKKTGFHLEFGLSAASGERFPQVLDELQFVYGLTERGDRTVIYIKSREAISDFLSVLGAENALARFNAVSAQREENNYENRALNCSSGNADRAAIASVEQVRAFSSLKRSGKLNELPAVLREAAEARLGDPALSLGELAQTLGITKSCLYHRFRKLMEYYRKG